MNVVRRELFTYSFYLELVLVFAINVLGLNIELFSCELLDYFKKEILSGCSKILLFLLEDHLVDSKVPVKVADALYLDALPA
jgi:hypothetical protein